MKKQHISPLFVTVWVIICAAVSFSLLQHVKTISKATSRLAVMETQTQELDNQNKELQKKIDDAQSPFIREKMIRDQLGMQKPGEVVVQIVDVPKGSASATELDVEKKPTERSIVDRISQFFENLLLGIQEKLIGRK